jgi:hypothetical protein
MSRVSGSVMGSILPPKEESKGIPRSPALQTKSTINKWSMDSIQHVNQTEAATASVA